MTMDDLFAMFAGKGKRSRKSLDTIHKRVRSPMPGQTQITSYFKPASQPSNSPKSNASTSSPCPAPRPCFPANRSAGTPQSSKASKPTKSSKPPKGFKSAVSASSTCSALRPYLPANGKPVTPQIANHTAEILQGLRALLEQWAGASAAPNNSQWAGVSAAPINGTSPSPPPPYGPMYSRRDDAERERGIV